MSFDDEGARVQFLLADAATVAEGKVNILGGGIDFIAVDNATAATVQFSLFISVSFEATQAATDAHFIVTLEDESGELVAVSSPSGESLGPLFKVEQTSTLEPKTFPEGPLADATPLRPEVNMVFNFATGLPLRPNSAYLWRVQINGKSREAWTKRMYVVMPSLPA